MKNRYPSISVQVLLAVLITVVTVLGVSSVVELNLLKKRETQRLQDKGAVTADRLANSLKYPLWNLNSQEARQVVHDELASVDVFRIRVVDEHGALYVGEVREEDGSIKPLDAQNSDAGYPARATLYSFSRDIDFKNTHVGAVAVDLTDRQLQVQLKDLRWEIAIKLFVLAALLSLVIFFTLRGLVIGPLSSLRNWVQQIHTTQMNRAPRFKGAGEINALADVFDAMSNRLEESTRELRSSEALLREFIKHTPAAIAMLDRDMRYLQVSDRFLTDYHLEGQNLLGKAHYEVFPNLPERWKGVHERVLAGAIERCDEEPYPGVDGSTEWLQWESLPWRRADGEIGGLILFTQVITERKRAEAALRISEEKFAKAFRASPIGIAVTRLKDGTYLEVNQALARVIGCDRSELIGKSTLELGLWAHLEERQKLVSDLERHGSCRNREITFSNRQGEPIDTLLSAELIELDGEPCILAVISDITERKRAEEDLKREKEFSEAALDSLPGIFFLMNADDKLLRWNKNFEAVAGYSADEIRTLTRAKLVAPYHRELRAQKIKECFEQGETTGELDILAKDGQPRHFFFSGRRFDVEGKPALLATGIDISERKHAETELRASEERLRALSAKVQSAREEEGARIAREIHDELGSALTGLKWDLERVDKELSEANGAAQSQVHERIIMMSSLIEATIDVVRRISSELRPGMLDDLGVVAAIEWQAQQIQKRTGLHYHWDSEVDNFSLTRERATAVFRIFQEITTNVLRHSAAKNFRVKLRQANGHFVLQVKDDGRGITESEQRNTRSLGLLGMKERALLVGGDVEITGAPNQGTTVTVRVPL